MVVVVVVVVVVVAVVVVVVVVVAVVVQVVVVFVNVVIVDVVFVFIVVVVVVVVVAAVFALVVGGSCSAVAFTSRRFCQGFALAILLLLAWFTSCKKDSASHPTLLSPFESKCHKFSSNISSPSMLLF